METIFSTFGTNMNRLVSNPDFYLTIEHKALAEYKDRGSRFLAYAKAVCSQQEVKDYLKEIKKEHPKATHYCYAYRLGYNGADFRQSDDGEPSGTAGYPILNQIDSRQLTNVLIVVVRYFGGTLLGAPGLVHAYKTSAALVLQLTASVQKPVLSECKLHFDYTKMNEVMTIVKKFGCTVLSREISLFCMLQIAFPKARMQEIRYLLLEIPSLEISPILSD